MQQQAPSPTEAAGIAHRVTIAMAGDQVGFETAHLAWRFAYATERSNKLLKTCADKLGKGEMIDAYVAFNTNRQSLEATEALNTTDFQIWSSCCERFSWRKPETLNTNLARLLKDSFTEVEAFREALLSEYRSRLMSKQSIDAYPVIKFLASYFKDDQGLQREYRRITTALTDDLEADMLVACGSTNSANDIQAALDKYREAGFEVPDKDGLISDALLAEKQINRTQLSERVEQLLGLRGALEAHDSDEWISVEAAYMTFAFDRELANDSDLLTETQKESLKKLRQNIAALRGTHDTKIQLTDALKAIGDRTPKRDEGERLENILAHAKSLAHPVEPALLAQAEAVLERRPARARSRSNRKQTTAAKEKPAKQSGKSKNPIYIGAAGLAASIAIAASFAFLGGDSDGNAQPVQQSIAKASVPHQTHEKAKPKQTTTSVQTVASVTPRETTKPSAATNDNAAKNDELDALLAKLASLVEAEPSPQNLATFNQELETAELLANELQADALPLADLERLRSEQQGRYEAHTEAVIANAQSAVKQAHLALDTAHTQLATDYFPGLFDKATAAVATSEAACRKASELNAPLDATRQEQLAARLADLEANRSLVEQAQQAIAEANTLPSYLEPLRQLLDIEALPQGAKTPVAQAISRSSELPSQLRYVLSQSASGYHFPDLASDFSPDQLIELSDEELEFLSRQIDNRVFSEVYTSTLRYYQGSSDPVSEVVVHVSKDLDSSEQKSGKSVSVSFTARGYDEEGRPSYKPHQTSYLKNRDGTVWGYFYTPAELSKESEYYNNVLNPKLKEIVSSPSPIKPLATIEAIANRNELSEAFRLYWVQQLIELMDIDPDKWGHRLAPSISEFEQFALATYGEKPSPTLWRALKRDRAEQSPDKLFASGHLTLVSKELIAFATLLNHANSGDFVLAGHVGANGSAKLHPQSRIQNGLWTINERTGMVERLEQNGRPLAFAPIVGYRPSGLSMEDAITDASQKSGLDLQQDKYRDQLPLVFAP